MINTNPHEEVIKAIQHMKNYTVEHLREQITQGQLAKAAGYSHYYSAEIFKILTGKTLFVAEKGS